MTAVELIQRIQNLNRSFWFDMVRQLKDILLGLAGRIENNQNSIDSIQVDQEIVLNINQTGTSHPEVYEVKNSANPNCSVSNFTRTGVAEYSFTVMSTLSVNRVRLSIKDKLKFDGETTSTAFIYHVSEATINGLYQNTYKIKTSADGVLEDTLLKVTFYPTV